MTKKITKKLYKIWQNENPALSLPRSTEIIVPFFGTIFYPDSEVVKKEKRLSKMGIKMQHGGSSQA